MRCSTSYLLELYSEVLNDSVDLEQANGVLGVEYVKCPKEMQRKDTSTCYYLVSGFS